MPSRLASGSRTTRPEPGWLAYTTPSGETAMNRTPASPFAKYVTERPAGTLSFPSSADARVAVSFPAVGDDSDAGASPVPAPQAAIAPPMASISPSGRARREASVVVCTNVRSSLRSAAEESPQPASLVGIRLRRGRERRRELRRRLIAVVGITLHRLREHALHRLQSERRCGLPQRHGIAAQPRDH